MKITENHIDEATSFFFILTRYIANRRTNIFRTHLLARWQSEHHSSNNHRRINEQIFISTIETAENRPEVIIIGTGAKQKFLHPKIAAALSAYGIGFECMNTASAFRTLVLLQGEGRSTWAWLWP